MSQPPAGSAAGAGVRNRGLRRVRTATGGVTAAAAMGTTETSAGSIGAAPGTTAPDLDPVPQLSAGRPRPGAAPSESCARLCPPAPHRPGDPLTR